MLVALMALAVAACTPAPARHPVVRVPGVASVELPGGFEAYDRPLAPYASRNPVHVDTAYFERGGSDGPGGHHCRAQVTVSPYDPAVTAPPAYVELLSTRLCDPAWFVSGNATWRERERGLWTADLSYQDVGWFGVDTLPATGVVLLAPERGLVVGVWAVEDQYSPGQAVKVARDVLASAR
ncbi:MAG: hypothetical protein AB7J32_09470 [Pseudonocardia sp.]